MTAEPYADRLAVMEQQLENTGCHRCGLTSCGCWDDSGRGWEGWLRFYPKKWGMTRAETIHEIVNWHLRGDEWLLDWYMQDEHQWIPERLRYRRRSAHEDWRRNDG